MNIVCRLFLLLLADSTLHLLPASELVGTAMCPGKFRMGGVGFGTPGVISWDVFAADKLEAEDESVLLKLHSGGYCILLPKSVLQVSANTATLLTGAAMAACANPCKAEVVTGSRRLTLQSGTVYRISVRDGVSIGEPKDFVSLFTAGKWVMSKFPYKWGIFEPGEGR